MQLAENTGRKKSRQKSPSGHHRTTVSAISCATKACIDNRKKSSDNMVNFGPLAAEICWRVWGTPVNFNGYRVLAVLLYGI